MRYTFWLFFCLMSFLVACMEPGKVAEVSAAPDLRDTKIEGDDQLIPEELLLLRTSEKYVPREDNLFGRFYNDRAEFFIIDNPRNQLYETKVNSITLCYLDGLLSKTTYIMNSNVSEKLIRRYGSFRIAGHDLKNRRLIESRKIWEDSTSKRRIGKELDNYRMSWTLGDQEIVYKVDKTVDEDQFIYMEMTDQYKGLIRIIERNY